MLEFIQVSIKGVTIQVPTIIMGLTFLAAGSTMPEFVASVISLRTGKLGNTFLLRLNNRF